MMTGIWSSGDVIKSPPLLVSNYIVYTWTEGYQKKFPTEPIGRLLSQACYLQMHLNALIGM